MNCRNIYYFFSISIAKENITESGWEFNINQPFVSYDNQKYLSGVRTILGL